jgi:hypothetical protein
VAYTRKHKGELTMKINANVLTEKGNLKPEARKAILANIVANPAILGTASMVTDKVFTLPVECEDGTVYVNIDLSVSTLHPADRKAPEKKAKAPKEAEVFEILD